MFKIVNFEWASDDDHARGTDVEIYGMQIFFDAWHIKIIPASLP